jgi:hypothetical protein
LELRKADQKKKDEYVKAKNALCSAMALAMFENKLDYLCVDVDTGECDSCVGVMFYCDYNSKEPQKSLWYAGHRGRKRYAKDIHINFLRKFASGLLAFLDE